MADFDTLIRTLVELGGSDLHLSSMRVPMMRLHGDMEPLSETPLSDTEVESLLMGIIPDRNRRQFEEHNDTDFAYAIEGFVRLRASVFRDRHGMGGVFRVVPTQVIPAEHLGLPKAVTDLCYLSKGLVVVTGPTGSGKSTTLAAMIDLINRTKKQHIITIEDPIEFIHTEKKCLITQREVNTHTETFASALRAALRQDPDIALVGEMRDLETIQIALETAETGHLVFGTLHTNTAASTIDRIIDCFPANRQNQIRTMLASSLKGVVSQTLCKKTSGGRTVALEVLLVDRGVSSLIRDAKNHQIQSAMQVGRALGMQLLNESLAGLVRQSTVTAEEAYLKSADRADLLIQFKKYGIPPPDMSDQHAYN